MVKLILVILYATSALTFALGQTGAEYGQPCSPSVPCISSDIQDPLRCKNGLCICLEGMFRHQGINRCVSQHGAPCTLRADDGQPIRTCTEFADCWPPAPAAAVQSEREAVNGAGDRLLNGICYCDQDSVHDPVTGHCKLTYNSARCRTPTDCDVRSQLTCRGGMCACQDEQFQAYDDNARKCKSLVGGSCIANPPWGAPECLGPFMNCNNGEDGTNNCICDSGFASNNDKMCGKFYNQACDPAASPIECHSQFVCNATETLCTCREEHMHQSGTCVIPAGESCFDSDPIFSCTDNSICQDGVCHCPSPDYKNGDDDHRCIGLYGASCSHETSPCNDEDFLECATNNVCKCKEKYQGDDEAKLCAGYIGQTCREGRNESCIRNSICKVGVDARYTCGCQDRYEALGEMECVGLYGVPCDPTVGCSSSRFLSCNFDMNVCSCGDPQNQIYEAARDACVARANSNCGEDANGIDCVANATCYTTVPMQCICNPGYTDEGGRCIRIVETTLGPPVSTPGP